MSSDDPATVQYLEREHRVPRDRASHQVGGGDDFGIDAFHFDTERRNLYLIQYSNSASYQAFKPSLQTLLESGMEAIFFSAGKVGSKNAFLRQLHSALNENRSVVDQVVFRFVFKGDPEEAEKSQILAKYREELENKKYLIDQFFGGRDVGLIVEFRSATGRVGSFQAATHSSTFDLHLENPLEVQASAGERMHLGLIRLSDLNKMHAALGPKFFDHNIRYGLGESEAVNRAISKALKAIIIDKADDPSTFAFNHNGITLYAERMEEAGEGWRITAPRLLNGAQTVTTLASFKAANEGNREFSNKHYEAIRVLCKVITRADQKFVTRVTINNNRQNPVEPWNLHANDDIQLELQDKFKDELGIYYERQENAFDQLGDEDLQEYGIQETKAIQMLKLTQTFLLTDGNISRASSMRAVFEDDRAYEGVFRRTRLRADARHILLCYKVQFRLRKLISEIMERGENKYAFVSRARNLLWALLAQGLLNHEDIEKIAETHGRSLSVANEYVEILAYLATARVRMLLSDLLEDRDYAGKVAEGNLSFLRTDKAFDKAMELARKKWKWEHLKLA
jgi:hypothetical protein